MATVYRSSITGRWVRKRFALQHPHTTQAVTVHPVKAVLVKAAAVLTPSP